MCNLNPNKHKNLKNLEIARQSISYDSRLRMKESLKEAWESGAYDNVSEKLKSLPKREISEQTRLNMSKARKKWLSENPDKHQWKLQKNHNHSHPCEKFKDTLRLLSIKFVEEYQPLEDRFFSIDIAFPLVKVGIEINGGQHYDSDGNLKKYYHDRHVMIENAGWKIYEIPHRICYHNEKLNNVIESIVKEHNLSTIDWSMLVDEQIKNQKSNQLEKLKNLEEKKHSIAKKHKNDELLILWKNAIQSIDVTQYGFIAKLALLMNCTHTHVRRVLKQNFPEIVTFQRKSEKLFK